MKENVLILQIKHGNQKALNTLISHYYPSIYRYIYLKIYTKEDAADITQEVFLRFIRQIPTYHHQGKLLNYLYTIAHSCCIDYIRKQKHFEDWENYENEIADPINVHVSTCSSLSKPMLRFSSIIGSLKVIDFIHCPLGCFSS